MKGWMRCCSEVTRAGEGFVARLPVEAADTLVVDAVFLVVSCMVAGKAKQFFRCSIAEGEVVEFLEERESIKTMEGVYKVGFLLIDDGISGSDVFETTVCLVGMVQGEERAARLAVGEDGDFQLFIV